MTAMNDRGKPCEGKTHHDLNYKFSQNKNIKRR